MNWLEELDKEGRKYRNISLKQRESTEKNFCLTPGMKIRSGGVGRGLARGMGKGPIGVPYRR